MYSYEPYSDQESEFIAERIYRTEKIVRRYRDDLKNGAALSDILYEADEYHNDLLDKYWKTYRKHESFVKLTESANALLETLLNEERRLIAFHDSSLAITRGISQVTELRNMYSSGKRILGIEMNVLNACRAEVATLLEEHKELDS